MSVDSIAGTAIGVAIGVILAHWLLALGGCAGAAPARSTSIHVEIEAENITVTSEGGAVDESQEAEGGEATTDLDLDATIPTP